MNMTRDQYHYETVDNIENDPMTLELIKLVKYHVIEQMSTCYKDMKNAKVSSNIIKKYIEEGKRNKEERIREIEQSLYDVLYSNALSAQLSDIKPEEMTKIQCDCPISKFFLYLLQTFTYDIEAIRYIISKIGLAMYYGVELQQKYLYIFLGDTNSGKTRFLKFIISVLGNKGGIISSRTSYYGTHQDRTHDIRKKAETARLWYMDEIGNRDFNREFFNQLTGNSPLFVRTNYSEGKIIKIAPTIFIFGNNPPIFTENCPALIERLKFYTFRSEFNCSIPVSFKYAKFPQISNFDKKQNDLCKGFLALLLHSICFSNCNSPFFLHRNLIDIPKNVQDSTVMYSPAIKIVKEILKKCDLVEDSYGIITLKRLVYLINYLPNNIMKSIKVATATDAIRFLDQIYPKSKISNDKINCLVDFKDKDFTLVYQGLVERDMESNDKKILRNGKNR